MMYSLKEQLKKSDNPIKVFIDNFSKIIDLSSTSSIVKLFHKPKMLELIVDNDLFFANEKTIFRKLNISGLFECLELMYNFNNGYVKSHLTNIFNYGNSLLFYKKCLDFLMNHGVSANSIINLLDANNVAVDYNNFTVAMLEKTHNASLIMNNIDYFLLNNSKLLEFKKILVSFDYKLKYNEEINDYIDTNPDLIIREIAIFNDTISVDVIEKEKYTSFLKQLIEEILQNEKLNYHDIEYLDSGYYSKVYKIGDKVLKIGNERKKFNIPFNKRFLKPLYRQNISSLDGKKTLFCIEITECVDTNDITDDDVYKVYKELRDEGLIWTDCKRSNLGRLKKDNKIYFDGITSVSKNSTGYLDDNDEILKKGELVIIDNDYIFPETEFFDLYDGDYSSLAFEIFKKYENRYNKEKMSRKL